MKKKTLAAGALGAAGLFLSLWGFFGGGTAAEHFPTAPKKTAAKAADEMPADTDAPQMKYDISNRPIRTKPLRDPFRLPEEREAAAEIPVKEKGTAAPIAEPVLRGIMLFGSDKRAVIETAGGLSTVTEGEKVGSWQVTEIREKMVILSGASGEKRLTI